MKFPFVLIATVILLFEEFVWKELSAFMAMIGQLPIFRQIEAWMASLGKWGSLALFLAPGAALFPVKLFAVWLLGNHHAYLGAATFVLAKIVGTALFARIYAITEPKITRFGWVCWIRDRVSKALAWAHGWIHKQAFYLRARAFVTEFREKIRNAREHWAKRRLRAAKAYVRSRRDGR